MYVVDIPSTTKDVLKGVDISVSVKMEVLYKNIYISISNSSRKSRIGFIRISVSYSEPISGNKIASNVNEVSELGIIRIRTKILLTTTYRIPIRKKKLEK